MITVGLHSPLSRVRSAKVKHAQNLGRPLAGLLCTSDLGSRTRSRPGRAADESRPSKKKASPVIGLEEEQQVHSFRNPIHTHTEKIKWPLDIGEGTDTTVYTDLSDRNRYHFNRKAVKRLS